MLKKKRKPKFSKELIKEYGEQTHRDHLRTGQPYEDSAWPSVLVAEGCGQIKEADENAFHAALVKYAKKTKFPDNFI